MSNRPVVLIAEKLAPSVLEVFGAVDVPDVELVTEHLEHGRGELLGYEDDGTVAHGCSTPET